MFYELTLTKELEVHPRFFGPKLKATLESQLIEKVPPFALIPNTAQWFS